MAETFRDMIAENKRKSLWLVVVFVLFNVVVAGIIGLAIIFYLDPELADHMSWTSGILIGVCAALVSFLLAYLSYMSGDQLILYTNGAKPMQKSDDPQLFNVVEEIAIAAGIPMPSVYLIHDPAPNAFATGRDPQTCVSRDHDRPARESSIARSCKESSLTRSRISAITIFA